MVALVTDAFYTVAVAVARAIVRAGVIDGAAVLARKAAPADAFSEVGLAGAVAGAVVWARN